MHLKISLLCRVAIAIAVVTQMHDVSSAAPPPITVAASVYGGFDASNSWHLSVCSSGAGELTTGYGSKQRRIPFQVSNEKMEQLRSLVKESKFLSKASTFGSSTPDGPKRSVTISVGYRSGYALFRNFDTLQNISDANDTRACLKVRHFVRDWIGEKSDVADFRAEENTSLDHAVNFIRSKKSIGAKKDEANQNGQRADESNGSGFFDER